MTNKREDLSDGELVRTIDITLRAFQYIDTGKTKNPIHKNRREIREYAIEKSGIQPAEFPR